MDYFMLRIVILFTALIVIGICTGAGWYEQAVLDTVWPKKPSIVRPVEGGVNRKLFWVPANILAVSSLLGSLWASWLSDFARLFVFVAIGLFAMINIATVSYFAPHVLRVEKDSILPSDSSSLRWVRLSRLRTPLSLGATIALSIAITHVLGSHF